MSEVAANVTLRGVTMGIGTGFRIDEPGIGGLGLPPIKTADTQLDGRDGSFGAPDFKDVRVLTIPLIVDADGDTDNLFNGLQILLDAWEPAEDGVDLELGLTLPHWGDLVCVGRPRGCDIDLVDAGGGIAAALCRFDGLAPVFVTP